MKVIDERGRVLPVDDSSVDYENEFIPCFANVVMIDDDVCLRDMSKNTSARWPRICK